MRLVICLFAAFPLAGCAGNALRALPSPSELATPEGRRQATDVRLSGECRQFTKQVQHPNVLGMNGKAAWKAADHALSTANGRLLKADECEAQQVEIYSK